jgi:uncharacterized protein YpmS
MVSIIVRAILSLSLCQIFLLFWIGIPVPNFLEIVNSKFSLPSWMDVPSLNTLDVSAKLSILFLIKKLSFRAALKLSFNFI